MSLNVDSMTPFEKATFQIYKAELPDQQQQMCDLNTWHEASISSTRADTLLRQNTALELGDEADWSLETLDDLDVSKDFYLPACEMLKQMDGVGIHNDNGISVTDFPEWRRFAGSSTAKPYVFW